MKIKYLFILLGIFWAGYTPSGEVESRVYTLNELKGKTSLEGETTHLTHLSFDISMISAGSNLDLSSDEFETLLIVKTGEVVISLGDEVRTVGPGSVALILPGDKYSLKAVSDTEYYEMEYLSKKAVNLQRGEEAGGSFIIDFDELEFNEHDRGGIRNYFNRPTAMMEYFEMHVTNLNGLIKSHEPHTHGAAEIVLMINGDTEMQIGEDFYQGKEGDVYFLGSEVPHAIENKAKEQCMYFAFQWE